jgi:hypothetical protein
MASCGSVRLTTRLELDGADSRAAMPGHRSAVGGSSLSEPSAATKGSSPGSGSSAAGPGMRESESFVISRHLRYLRICVTCVFGVRCGPFTARLSSPLKL